MALKAKQPKKDEPQRFKFFLYGPAGSGKTIACIQLFPQAVIIDGEHGCDHYKELIADQGSALLQSNDVDEIIDELRALLTEDHEYKSVILDPVTTLYQGLQERWADIFRRQAIEKKKFDQVETEDWGFGYWAKVKRDYKRVTTLLDKLDMNVAMTAHQKDQYSNDNGGTPTKVGVTFDAMKGADYFFDNVFRMFLNGNRRMVQTIKQRAYPQPVFEPTFEWDVATIRRAWGEDVIERKASTIQLASREQVAEIRRLVEFCHMGVEDIQKWHDKASAEDFEDYPADSLQKCIEFLKKKIPAAS